MKSRILAISVILAASVFSDQSAAAQPSDQPMPENTAMVPEIELSPATVHFGNVLAGGDVVIRTFSVNNVGEDALTISSIALSGNEAGYYSIVPETVSDLVPPDSGIVFTVTLVPPVQEGFALGSVDLSTNAGNVIVPIYTDVRVPSTYYVSPTGNNANPGTKELPWKTMQFAVDEAVPGDSLLIGDGTYEGPVIMTRSGAPGAYVTLKSINPLGAKVEVANGEGDTDGIKAAANYLTIDGFEIYDAAPGIGHHGNGVTVYNNHHINILNNLIYDFGGSGIQTVHFDHVLIENNVVHNNAKYNPNQTSGISLYQARAVDDEPGYHAIIRNNRSYSNINLVPLNLAGTFDGNGILIDDFWNSGGDDGNDIEFPHRTLIENNLCYDNGGKGIQVYRSSYVDIFNNTAYHNNHDVQNQGHWRGELSIISSTDTIWRNNIGVANPGEGILEWNRAMFINKGGDTIWENNITFSGTPGDLSILVDNGTLSEEYITANNMTGVDPMFMDAINHDFNLDPESPAVDAGSDAIFSFNDINYLVRPAGSVDIGAYEYEDESLPVELTYFDAVVSNNAIQLVWETASELNNAGFAVELQAAGRDFEQVLFVEGHGTTTSIRSYDATLPDVAPGAYALRLKQVDFDGTFAYSETVEVVLETEQYHLGQSYPNPFNPQTRIRYSLPVGQHVTLEVFDVLGRSVRTLVNEEQVAGVYSVVFDAQDLANGTYVYRLTAGSFTETKSMILMK